MASVEDAVTRLQGTVESTLRSARETASRITGSVVPDLLAHAFDFQVDKPNLAPPPTMSDLFPGVDQTNSELIRLDAETEKWLGKYFPELTACLRDKPEQWLCKIISGSDPFGDSTAVVDALWHEARDRAYRAASTETRSILATFAERGFSLPPGVAVRLVTEAEQRAGQAIADVNRSETARMAELKLDLLKFAEEQAIRLKLGVMDTLRAFYVSWLSIPDKDIERARIRAQAQASLYQALSSYYNVELGFEQLRLRAAETGIDAAMGIDRNKIAAFSSNRPAEALAQAVRGFTDVASSASNAGSALVAEITTG